MDGCLAGLLNIRTLTQHSAAATDICMSCRRRHGVRKHMNYHSAATHKPHGMPGKCMLQTCTPQDSFSPKYSGEMLQLFPLNPGTEKDQKPTPSSQQQGRTYNIPYTYDRHNSNRSSTWQPWATKSFSRQCKHKSELALRGNHTASLGL